MYLTTTKDLHTTSKSNKSVLQRAKNKSKHNSFWATSSENKSTSKCVCPRPGGEGVEISESQKMECVVVEIVKAVTQTGLHLSRAVHTNHSRTHVNKHRTNRRRREKRRMSGF